MPTNGLEEMERRAETVGSPWRIVAAITLCLVIAGSVIRKTTALMRRA
jgi:hypothetical protein